MINSGGIKMIPEELEAKLSAHIQIPFMIGAEDDLELGQRVILVLEYPSKKPQPDYSQVLSALSTYERPKKIYTLSQFPYTETGKIKRMDVLRLLKSYKK